MSKKIFRVSTQAPWASSPMDIADGKLLYASQSGPGDYGIDLWMEVDSDPKVEDRTPWTMLIVSEQAEVPDDYYYLTSLFTRNYDVWHIYRKDVVAETPKLEPFAEDGPYTYHVNVSIAGDRRLLFTAQASLGGVRSVVERYADLDYNEMTKLMCWLGIHGWNDYEAFGWAFPTDSVRCNNCNRPRE